MKLILIITSLVFITILSFGPDDAPIATAIKLPIGLKSDGCIETNRLIAKLKSQQSFSFSLKNRTLKSVLKELNASLDIKNEVAQLENDIPFSIDFEIKEMNALEALDLILKFKGVFGSFEKGSLRIINSGLRC